jgi:hypothetical protein
VVGVLGVGGVGRGRRSVRYPPLTREYTLQLERGIK